MTDDIDFEQHTPAPAPPGSRAEQILLVCKLIGDLLSTPFHLGLFLLTRRRHRRKLLADLKEAAS